MMSQLLVIASVILIGASGAVINATRTGRSKVAYEGDRNSLLWFRLVIPAAIGASLLLYSLKFGAFTGPRWLPYAGFALVAAGLLIRWVSVLSLGDRFTVKVSVMENHKLKTDGMYKHVRHPSYTGLLIYYVGLGLEMHNWLCFLILTTAPLAVVCNRINVEETSLRSHFGGEYAAYSRRSWRLMPFVY